MAAAVPVPASSRAARTRGVERLATRMVALALGAVALAADAAEPVARRFAEPAAAQGAPAPVSSLAQVTFSLALVLAAVFAAAWLLRRVRGLSGRAATGGIEVVAERAVGPRERVVLLQVGRRQVLVGVAQGSVRALESFDAPPAEPAP